MNYLLTPFRESLIFFISKKKFKILSGFFLDEIFNKELFSILEKDKNEMLKSLLEKNIFLWVRKPP